MPSSSDITPKIASSLILLGATGDLAQRMLIPSLFALHAEGLLPPAFKLFGCARSALDTEKYRAIAAEALQKYLPRERQRPEEVSSFLARVFYEPIDLAQPDGFVRVREALGEDAARRVAVFLSIAPSLFVPTIAALRIAGLTGSDVRVALEKPLGHDLASSKVINDTIAEVFPEERTFRIDHYLGKETVQNLLALRFGNTLFEPLWNAQAIDHVQISVAETVGLEGRLTYFDSAGALRDMVQNHMLQLLALVAMEPPVRFESSAVRDEKVKVLRALRPIDAASAPSHGVIGQYGAGTMAGNPVPGYLEDLGGVSDTETFVALKAHIDNWRWKGVPFYLRTGKRLAARKTEIAIQFKPVPHSIFADRGGALEANRLRIRLQPEEDVRLLVMAKVPGLDREGIRLEEVSLDLSLATAFADSPRRIAYERLLLDFLEGDSTLFVRRDEVEAQWSWIDQVRAGWAGAGMKPVSYVSGGWGPPADFGLNGHLGRWHD